MTRSYGGTDLKRLHREWRRRTKGRLAVVLDGVQGPFNVGAVIRTAAAERVDHLWYTGGATTADNTRVGKTAMGTERYLQTTEVAEPAHAIAAAKGAGYTVVAIELAEGASPLHEIDLSGDICLVVGHEDRGVSKAVLETSDHIGFIPQLGKVGSLNVATAASIALYEVRRQHWSAGSGQA